MKCDKCGEFVNWDDPNIHYGGHTCDPEKLEKTQQNNTCDKCQSKYLEGYNKGYLDATEQMQKNE